MTEKEDCQYCKKSLGHNDIGKDDWLIWEESYICRECLDKFSEDLSNE